MLRGSYIFDTLSFNSGNETVTMSGVGFTDNGVSLSDVKVRMCIPRLNDNTANKCDTFELASVLSVNTDEVVARTPVWTKNTTECRENRGNRLFGDTADVWLYYTQPGGNGRDFPPSLRIPNEAARVKCGTYRFGPVVNSLSRTKVGI